MDSIYYESSYEKEGKSPGCFLLFLIALIVLVVITWKTVYADQQPIDAETTIENATQEFMTESGSSDSSPVFLSEASPSSNPAGPIIFLQAATGKTITFKTQNGNTINDTLPQVKEIPHLVLSRNSKLADVNERLLIVAVSNLEVPPAGLSVGLKLETQHGDPDLGGEADNRILVWNESRRIENPGEMSQTGETVTFEVEFGEIFQSSSGMVATPTDYLRYEITLEEGNQTFSVVEDYALLVERQAVLDLNFGTENAGPTEIAVYYSDMFPFQKDNSDAATRLSRADIPNYVESQLLPEMIAGIQHQMSWGFSWDKAWTNIRVDEAANRLGVALTDGRTWYHGPAPVRGHSAMSINVNGGNNEEYDSLTDGIMSTFHHELFHSFQRSIHQSYGGNGQVSGSDKAWRFFSEGTASLIPSVAQPEVQYSQSGSPRAYLSKASKFVGGRGFSGDLNTSYAEMTPYRSAIYWRFLFEQCGGMSGDTANPAVGMGIIRRTLEVLFSKDIVDIQTSTDLVGALPLIMDVVLSSPEAALCPFGTFEQSLTYFARSIYALHLESGRCVTPGFPEGCGFYDPNSLYSQPLVSQLHFSGEEIVFGAEDQSHPSGIRSSFGMDFIDIVLDQGLQGKQLTIEISAKNGAAAKLNVQLVKLVGPEAGILPGAPTVETNTISGSYIYTINEIDLQNFDRLGLIITRLDNNESLDVDGQYTIVLR